MHVVWLLTRTRCSFLIKQNKVQRKSHPLRRYEARGDHLPLGLPFGAGKLVELDRGLATLRLRCARYARIRLERPEAPQEHSDQERGRWWCQCRPLAVHQRRRGQQRQRQVGGDGRGRRDQGVGNQVPRVKRTIRRQEWKLYSTVYCRCEVRSCLDDRLTGG
jgi:hypothetical protein